MSVHSSSGGLQEMGVEEAEHEFGVSPRDRLFGRFILDLIRFC